MSLFFEPKKTDAELLTRAFIALNLALERKDLITFGLFMVKKIKQINNLRFKFELLHFTRYCSTRQMPL